MFLEQGLTSYYKNIYSFFISISNKYAKNILYLTFILFIILFYYYCNSTLVLFRVTCIKNNKNNQQQQQKETNWTICCTNTKALFSRFIFFILFFPENTKQNSYIWQTCKKLTEESSLIVATAANDNFICRMFLKFVLYKIFFGDVWHEHWQNANKNENIWMCVHFYNSVVHTRSCVSKNNKILFHLPRYEIFSLRMFSVGAKRFIFGFWNVLL